MTRKTAQPEVVAPTPRMVNPDGSPGLVAPGDMIESAWGNAVSNEFTRARSWHKTISSGGTFVPARSDFTGLAVSVPFVAGRVYQASIFVPGCIMSANSEAHLYICNGNGQVLNTATYTGNSGVYFSLFATLVTSPVAGTQGIKAMMNVVAGTLTVIGDADHQNVLVVEELSKTAG